MSKKINIYLFCLIVCFGISGCAGVSQTSIDEQDRVRIKNNFKQAMNAYKQQHKLGWTVSACAKIGSMFSNLGKQGLSDGYYNAGLVFHQCHNTKQAERMFQKALDEDSMNFHAMTALGEIEYKQGEIDSALSHFNQAVKIGKKESTAARNNIAWHLVMQMRKTKNTAQAKQYENEAKKKLSRVLAIDSSNVKTYVIYAHLLLTGSVGNKTRLDFAKLLLDKGAEHNEKYAPLWNAQGLILLRRNNVSQSLKMFEKAIALDPAFWEARMNAGNIVLGFRKYDDAKEQFSTVLAYRPKNYDAWIGLGIAYRGLKNFKEAEKAYNKAIALSTTRPEAIFNLALLYKDFYAAQSVDEKQSLEYYTKAHDYLTAFTSRKGISSATLKEAIGQMEDCDKYIVQLKEIIALKAEEAKAEKAAKLKEAAKVKNKAQTAKQIVDQ